jgi:nucleoside-diphosphate-sugar epimerase
VYISDISKVKRDLGWEPKRGIGDGIMALCKWVKENRELFEK